MKDKQIKQMIKSSIDNHQITQDVFVPDMSNKIAQLENLAHAQRQQQHAFQYAYRPAPKKSNQLAWLAVIPVAIVLLFVGVFGTMWVTDTGIFRNFNNNTQSLATPTNITIDNFGLLTWSHPGTTGNISFDIHVNGVSLTTTEDRFLDLSIFMLPPGDLNIQIRATTFEINPIDGGWSIITSSSFSSTVVWRR